MLGVAVTVSKVFIFPLLVVSFLWSLCLAALQWYPGSLPGALLMIAVTKSWERKTSFLYLQWES